MTQKPPEDQDPIVQEILKQLEKKFAMEKSYSPEIDAKTDMETSIQGIEEDGFADISSLFSDELEETTMQVVDGGKAVEKPESSCTDEQKHEQEDKTDKIRQQWKIVEEPESLSPEADIAHKLTEFLQNTLQGDVQVHVMEHPLEMFEQLRTTKKKSPVHKGLISLQHTESQLLVDTENPSTYRISCTSGKFSISVASKNYVLYAGQSLDVQGNYIQVYRISDTENTHSIGLNKGWYVSLAEISASS
jgi:hypothetical protein